MNGGLTPPPGYRRIPWAERVGAVLAFLTQPLRLAWWILFGNFHRLVRWWFFWRPLCWIGVHGPRPAFIIPHGNTVPDFFAAFVKVCPSCGARVYGEVTEEERDQIRRVRAPLYTCPVAVFVGAGSLFAALGLGWWGLAAALLVAVYSEYKFNG